MISVNCTVLLALLAVACGDNTAGDPFTPPPATSHPPESTAIRRGTYELAPAGANDAESWVLSADGIVKIPLRGTSRAVKVGWVRLSGKAAVEPDVAIVDQVDNESLVLATSITGDLVGGLVVHDLVEPLFLGSDGEIVWIRVTARGAEVELFSVTWGPP